MARQRGARATRSRSYGRTRPDDGFSPATPISSLKLGRLNAAAATLRGFSLRVSLGAVPLDRLHDPDRDLVETDERDSERELAENIRRGQNGGQDEDADNRITPHRAQ